MTKVDKSISSKFNSIMQNYIDNKTIADERILKLGNAFLNAQHCLLNLPFILFFLYHSIIVHVHLNL